MPENELARNLLTQDPGRELSHATATCLPNVAPLPRPRKSDKLEMPEIRSDRREKADDYLGELLRHGRYRIITCKGHLQWIIQFNRRADGSVSGTRWEAMAYITTRDVLISRWHEETGVIAPELYLLPSNHRATL